MAQNNNKDRGRVLIIILLVLIMVLSGLLYLRSWLKDKKTREEYERLVELARETSTASSGTATEASGTESESREKAYVSPVNFEQLLGENPDTVGWIRIPDTRIDYPIVQGTDNDYYLHHDFYGKESAGGSIYLDYESQPDFVGRNNILYGHHMKNGTMFKDVTLYKEQEFLKEHQYFSIYTPDREIRLKAVACYYGEADPVMRKTRFGSQDTFDAFVKDRLEPCDFKEDIQYPARNLYTFITCSYELDDARTFLFAVEVDENQKEIGMDLDYEKKMVKLINDWVEEQKAQKEERGESAE